MTVESATERFKSIGDCYLIGYGESMEEGSLVLAVTSAQVSDQITGVETGNSGVDDVFRSGRQNLPKADKLYFELVFDTYVSFSVTDEMLMVPQDGDDFSSRLRVNFESVYLSYIRRATRYFEPEKLNHYSVVCNNYVVDVASVDGPAISIKMINEFEGGSFFKANPELVLDGTS